MHCVYVNTLFHLPGGNLQKYKKYKHQVADQIPAEMIQAGGTTVLQ
jgi:hypothetical protein